MRARLLIASSALLVLAGCQSGPPQNVDGGQYWQRVSASSATYTRGPKAQQILNQDIAACVVEMRELERLGAIREPIKTDVTGRVIAAPNTHGENRMNPDVPDRNGNLYEELAPYSDFDGCMRSKGWERVAWVPYGVGQEAQRTYFDSNAVYQHTQETQQVQKAAGANEFNH